MEYENETLSKQLKNAMTVWMKTPAAVDKGIVAKDLGRIFKNSSPLACMNAFLDYGLNLSQAANEKSFFDNNGIDVIFLKNAFAPAILRETKDLHEQALMAELNEDPACLTLWHKASESAIGAADIYGHSYDNKTNTYLRSLSEETCNRVEAALRL